MKEELTCVTYVETEYTKEEIIEHLIHACKRYTNAKWYERLSNNSYYKWRIKYWTQQLQDLEVTK